jgi:hypothetical protein
MMTLPYERYNAIVNTEKLLHTILKTPRVPKEIKDFARSCIRHYPTEWDMNRASESVPELFGKEFNMRKRIKELAGAAYDQAVPETYTHLTAEQLERVLDKFAELIIKDCVDYINYRTEDWDAKLRWIFNDGSRYMEVNVESLLKDHFGGKID